MNLCHRLLAAVFAGLTVHGSAVPEILPPLDLPVPPAALTQSRRIAYGTYMNGGKIGWILDTRAPGEWDGKRCVRTTLEGHLEIVAMEHRVAFEIVQHRIFDASPPHRALRIESTQKQDGQTRTIVLRLKQAHTYAVTVTEAGETRDRPDTELDFRLSHLTSPEVWAADPARKPGESIGAVEFDDETLSLTDNTLTLTRQADWTGPGGKLAVWEADAYDHERKLATPARIARHDGTLVKIQMGGIFEMRMEPEAVAKRKGDEPGDVFLAFSIKSDRKLGEAADLTKLEALLTAPPDTKAPDLPDTVNQTATRTGDGMTVRITRGGGEPQPATAADRTANLKPTLRYPAEREEIRKLAAEAVAGAATDADKVRQLLRFTDTYLTDSYEVEALSVMDLLKSRKGECSAHALLFATLARAAGIPAREAWGWLYMGDTYQAFGGHAWNEVILDGRWVPVDAVFQQFQLDAGHLQAGSGETGSASVAHVAPGLRLKIKTSGRK